MGPALKTTPLEERLSSPAYQHAEGVDSEVVELNVGTKTHARIQARIACKLGEYEDVRAAEADRGFTAALL